MIKRASFMALVLLAVLLVSMALPGRASAQDPTPQPTITPTPSYLQAVPMSTGSELIIEKRITYGDVAIVAAVLVLATISLVANMIKIPRQWFLR